MQKEIWKTIPGWQGRYQISNLGRVKSFGRTDYKWKVPRILKPKPLPTGYLRVTLGVKTDQYIHRLVAKAFIPNPSRYPFVNHLDGDKGNNIYSNLEWCNQKQNLEHAVKNGLMASQKGETNHAAKLTEAQVRKILELHATGKYSFSELSRMFNVSHGYPQSIIRGDRWSHIKM